MGKLLSGTPGTAMRRVYKSLRYGKNPDLQELPVSLFVCFFGFFFCWVRV